MKKIGFEALIKDIHSKSLVSGDKATRIILEFDSANALNILNTLNGLHRADTFVSVIIAEKD